MGAVDVPSVHMVDDAFVPFVNADAYLSIEIFQRLFQARKRKRPQLEPFEFLNITEIPTTFIWFNAVFLVHALHRVTVSILLIPPRTWTSAIWRIRMIVIRCHLTRWCWPKIMTMAKENITFHNVKNRMQ